MWNSILAIDEYFIFRHHSELAFSWFNDYYKDFLVLPQLELDPSWVKPLAWHMLEARLATVSSFLSSGRCAWDGGQIAAGFKLCYVWAYVS